MAAAKKKGNPAKKKAKAKAKANPFAAGMKMGAKMSAKGKKKLGFSAGGEATTRGGASSTWGAGADKRPRTDMGTRKAGKATPRRNPKATPRKST